MACATVLGTTTPAMVFAIASEELALLTQSLEIVLSSDKAEARNGCGEVVAVAYYNRKREITIEGLGALGATVDDIGNTVTLATTTVPASISTAYIENVTARYSNTGFLTSTVKAVEHDALV